MTITVERRIELNKFVKEFLSELSEEEKDHFFSYTRSVDPQTKTYAGQPRGEEMNVRQVQVFERVLMPFGNYKDIPIGNVPYDYLCRLFDPNPFMKKLKLYLEYCNKHRHRS